MQLLIITPIKNEESTIEVLINSVLNQTVRPKKWIIIDDFSTDNSLNIVKKYQIKHNFIKLIKPKKNSQRSTGRHIVELLNHGLEYARKNNFEWDILLKLDGDLKIQQKNYFEYIINEFSNNKKLGIASGSVFYMDGKKKIIETKYLWHTQGQTKFYRRSCFENMGSLKPFKGWDGIDDIFARHYGYITKVFPQFEIRHFYRTQSRTEEGGWFGGIKREALGYRNRAYPIIMYILKSIVLLKKKPFILYGICFFVFGIYYIIFKTSMINKKEKKIVRKFIFLRFFGKIKLN